MTSPLSVLTRTPTQTVQAFLDAFARHDIDAALAVADPQVSVTVHPLGLHERRRGRVAQRPGRPAARVP